MSQNGGTGMDYGLTEGAGMAAGKGQLRERVDSAEDDWEYGGE